MGKIIAIGGGEIGRPNTKIETKKIDSEIVRLTESNKPRLLFLPTASSDSILYFNVVKKYFGDKLKCNIDVLYLIKNKYSKKEIEDKIFSADIIYVGGGNTLKMMSCWKKLGVDKILKVAYKNKKIVLSGLSAGAICWFKYGCSDSLRMVDDTASLIRINGLNFIPALFCPHYDVEEDRKICLKKIMKKTSGIAIAVDNCCAIEIINEQYRIISSKDTANAYKVYWKNGKYFENTILKCKEFNSLKTLLRKNNI